jgi:RNA polymerase sigma factor (sigma-70 family)
MAGLLEGEAPSGLPVEGLVVGPRRDPALGERHLTWHELVRRLQADATAPDFGKYPPERDESVWQEVRARVGRLARLAGLHLQLSQSDADDLAQGVMLDFQTTDLLRRLEESVTPAAYLFSCLRNRARDLVKRKDREVALLGAAAQELVAESLDGDAAGGNESGLAALNEALRRLSREDLELIKLRFWKGLSIRSIAQRRSEPYSRVAVRLFRLRRRLAASLGKAGGKGER